MALARISHRTPSRDMDCEKHQSSNTALEIVAGQEPDVARLGEIDGQLHLGDLQGDLIRARVAETTIPQRR
jgi:hypothetical protein